MRYLLVLALLHFDLSGYSQKLATEKSKVTFYSKAAIEDIKASTTKASSLISLPGSEIVFVITIKDFVSAKSLMQEHFNEKYMESEKFPKATFEGKLSGFNAKAEGVQHAIAKGHMTIHGVSKEVEIAGTMTVVNGKINLESKFMVKLADYNIDIPKLLFQKIAEQVEVTVEFTYTPQ